MNKASFQYFEEMINKGIEITNRNNIEIGNREFNDHLGSDFEAAIEMITTIEEAKKFFDGFVYWLTEVKQRDYESAVCLAKDTIKYWTGTLPEIAQLFQEATKDFFAKLEDGKIVNERI